MNLQRVLLIGLLALALRPSRGLLHPCRSPRSMHTSRRGHRATPGCAVGVSDDGRIVLEKAYGMADLEHGVPNRPDTIFEAGSVSKQFTAAAVLLLAARRQALARRSRPQVRAGTA